MVKKHKIAVNFRPAPEARPTVDELRKAIRDNDVDTVDGLIDASDWDGTAGTGKAILLPDGSELLNPVPHAAPVGFEEEDAAVDRLWQKLVARQRILEEDAFMETPDEAMDFGDDEEVRFSSQYEVYDMKDEAPGLQPDARTPAQVAEDAALAAKVEAERADVVAAQKPPDTASKP